MAGLQVTSPSSCASAHAARAAASRPGRRVDEGAAEGESAGESGQRAAVAGTVDPCRRQLLHCRVVEQIGCGDGDQLEAAEGDVGVHVGREECPDGATHRRDARRRTRP